MRRSSVILFLIISGFTLGIGTFLYTATPDRDPITVYLPIFLLTAVLLAIPAGLFMSIRRYGLLLLAALLVVSAVPLIGGGPLESLACTTHDRMPVRDLDAQAATAQVNFCGELVLCELVALGTEGFEQEVCVVKDLRTDDQIAFFNYILPNQLTASSSQLGEAEALSLRDDPAGTIVVRDGRWEPSRDIACAVPGVCALQPIISGEVYSSPAIYDIVRR